MRMRWPRYSLCGMPFRDVIGHGRIVSLLSRAIARDSLPPALLFAGPSGVGKRRVATALAAAINCQAPRSADGLERDACGTCPSCARIARGVHPDVITLSPGESGAIKIEAVRDVIDRAGYRPFEGRRRVVIVDEADALVPAAQNALLKTLEEPPSASIFLLVTASPDALLPTVRSRCPRLRFGSLSDADVARALVRDHDVDPADASAAAAAAEGSVGVALSAESAGVEDARDSAVRLLQAAARATDPTRLVEAVKDLTGKKSTSAGEREELANCLRVAASLLRDLGLLATGADPKTLANADARPLLDGLSRAYGADRTVHAYGAVYQALDALDKNASPKIVADWLVLQL
jgi:DNA polymerase-3 subunit delta'